ncbi:zinc-regulated transporter 3-like [Teratosphaeria destructans]|uniref:Zinc-regulated transporter 3-like n=1 Tax=Teratosphaeria destructans TaxID=418781 RepID=A0A9W7SQX7_9PEZI|nr:zinc-regulated transporter 3-like [Teratosphaeria destructans]
MGLSNDERGWVMTCLSGVACVLGASVICVDIIVRQFPGKKNFRIQDSDAFLSVSLSLSFGVMLFSALYNMLPHAKSSLQDGGFTPKQASWIMMACFMGGVLGIQLISRIMHKFIPSHVVDCEHSHDDGHKGDGHPHGHGHGHGHGHEPPRRAPVRKSSLPGHLHRDDSEDRPSSRQRANSAKHTHTTSDAVPVSRHEQALDRARTVAEARPARRPSFQQRVTDTFRSFVSGKNSPCGDDGPCHGFSEPCGSDCFKNVNGRGGFKAPSQRPSHEWLRRPMTPRSITQPVVNADETSPLLQHIVEEPTRLPPRPTTVPSTTEPEPDVEHGPSRDDSSATLDDPASSEPDHHHHHVPANAFLSIGLQTSIAIALHKLPEGFITYATNHANPALGVSVFLALFIHNITEGFALALPLYLAINSRFKAMLVSFVLGGLSQPIGAAIAEVWFRLAGEGRWKPDEGVYGGMFAVTAGIMASVALQLFGESLDLSHSKVLCMVGAFVGMGILGVSSALTA